MKLHNDKAAFTKAIMTISRSIGILPPIVEKDYYVTLFLKELTKRIPSLLFKGGTSLSKCHKIINRFSEDIDLTLEEEKVGNSAKKNLKKTILEVCKALNLTLLNEENIRSRRDFNKYKIDYSPIIEETKLKPNLIVETTFIVHAYPSEAKTASSIIGNYLLENNQTDLAAEYDLIPFPIKVQSLNRTLIDKIFAVCDYYLRNKTEEHSRHIYDISKLLSEVRMDASFMDLFGRVRADRKDNDFCLSAKDECDIAGTLEEIIDKEVYKPDYNAITSQIIYDNVTYDEAIEGLKKIRALLG